MFKSVAIVTSAAVVFTVSLAARGGQDPVSGRQPTDQRPQTPTPSPNPSSNNPNSYSPTKGAGNGTSKTMESGVPGDPPTGVKAKSASARQALTGVNSFLTKAAQGGKYEIELAKLAESKAGDSQVKSYAQMIDSDHTSANNELSSLGSKKSVDLSTDLSAVQRSTKARLDKLSGAAFDRVYIAQMVKDHQMDIREFETASKLSDPDVKGFVEKTLPTLRHHLEEAQRIEKALPAAGARK